MFSGVKLSMGLFVLFLEEKMAENESVEENATFLLDVKSFNLGGKAPHWKVMGRKQLN